MSVDRLLHDWILPRTYRIGDTSARECVVGPACQKEKNAKLNDA
jgi:hypothetical protein